MISSIPLNAEFTPRPDPVTCVTPRDLSPRDPSLQALRDWLRMRSTTGWRFWTMVASDQTGTFLWASGLFQGGGTPAAAVAICGHAHAFGDPDPVDGGAVQLQHGQYLFGWPLPRARGPAPR